MKKNLLLLTFVLLSSTFIQAQSNLFIDDSYTIEEMISDFFDNPDVVTSNITYTGDPMSVAFFDAGGTDLGVNAGIVFTSGFTQSLIGPNDQGGSSGSTNGGNDVDLAALGGIGSSNDVAIIEFDFTINTSGSFNFNYVFGSEEYPEYVCSGFNDAFGFLVSGPGISGPFSNSAENITTIPGSTETVSINNVNDNSGCGPSNAQQYYVDNTNGVDLQFDGHTTALPASFYAVAGETYHAKLVVGDIGDSVFDSGVFLSFNSLGSDSLLTPPSEFAFTVSGNQVDFTNLSKYAREWNWDFGNSVTSSERNPGTISYSTPGTYTVTLTTQNFCCTDTYTTTVEVGTSNALAVDIQTNNNPLACFGDQNAGISLSITGGTAPYTYFWAPAVPDLNNVGAGEYTYVITDNDGNEITGTVLITQPDEIALSTVSTPETDNQSNGTAAVQATGGTTPYTYLWSNGATTSEINNLSVGTYSVTITDANGCTHTTFVPVDLVITVLSVSVTTTNNPLACFGDENASATIELSGGSPPFTIEWIPDADPTALAAGEYTFVITDSDGNTQSSEVIITQPDELLSNTSSSPSTGGQMDGMASATATGGVAPYSYLWSNGASTSTIENLNPALYQVTITDANDCTSENEVEVQMTTAVDDLSKQLDLTFSPNPAREFIAIQHSSDLVAQGIVLYNMLGERFETPYEAKAGQVELSLSAKIPTGVYLVWLEWEDGSWSSGRFVKK